MVGHCFHRTRLALGGENTFVATCDPAIVDYVESIGGRAVMTSTDHVRATSRTLEAVEVLEAGGCERMDVVVMVQGDEPLVMPGVVQLALESFVDPEIQILNIVYTSTDPEAIDDPNNVKVVVDRCGDALYFSRAAIPRIWDPDDEYSVLIQTGVIAFRREALFGFERLDESDLERIESIDMNRVLDHGGRVRTLLSDVPFVGVDTPAELAVVEDRLNDDPIFPLYADG